MEVDIDITYHSYVKKL